MRTTATRLATAIALGSSCLASQTVEARAIRIDDGLAVGASGSWSDAGFFVDTPFLLGFDLAFLGFTADTVVVHANGSISLRDGATLLGSITAATINAPFAGGSAWDETSPLGPIADIGSDSITDALRIVWQSEDDGSQSQISLFAAASGDSFIEFNYWDGFNFDLGLNISETDTPLGLIANAANVEQFNLRSYIAANQSACLESWGAFDDNNLPDPNLPAPGDGCTAYFPNANLTAVDTLLPTAFQVANGGTAEEFNPVANYRYVVHYAAATTPPPPQTVPEPTTLSLLLGGLALVAAQHRRARRSVGS